MDLSHAAHRRSIVGNLDSNALPAHISFDFLEEEEEVPVAAASVDGDSKQGQEVAVGMSVTTVGRTPSMSAPATSVQSVLTQPSSVSSYGRGGRGGRGGSGRGGSVDWAFHHPSLGKAMHGHGPILRGSSTTSTGGMQPAYPLMPAPAVKSAYPLGSSDATPLPPGFGAHPLYPPPQSHVHPYHQNRHRLSLVPMATPPTSCSSAPTSSLSSPTHSLTTANSWTPYRTPLDSPLMGTPSSSGGGSIGMRSGVPTMVPPSPLVASSEVDPHEWSSIATTTTTTITDGGRRYPVTAITAATTPSPSPSSAMAQSYHPHGQHHRRSSEDSITTAEALLAFLPTWLADVAVADTEPESVATPLMGVTRVSPIAAASATASTTATSVAATSVAATASNNDSSTKKKINLPPARRGENLATAAASVVLRELPDPMPSGKLSRRKMKGPAPSSPSGVIDAIASTSASSSDPAAQLVDKKLVLYKTGMFIWGRGDSLTHSLARHVELCRSFEETGRCKYGTRCHFAHSLSELRPVERHSKYKTEVCRVGGLPVRYWDDLFPPPCFSLSLNLSLSLSLSCRHSGKKDRVRMGSAAVSSIPRRRPVRPRCRPVLGHPPLLRLRLRQRLLVRVVESPRARRLAWPACSASLARVVLVVVVAVVVVALVAAAAVAVMMPTTSSSSSCSSSDG